MEKFWKVCVSNKPLKMQCFACVECLLASFSWIFNNCKSMPGRATLCSNSKTWIYPFVALQTPAIALHHRPTFINTHASLSCHNWLKYTVASLFVWKYMGSPNITYADPNERSYPIWLIIGYLNNNSYISHSIQRPILLPIIQLYNLNWPLQEVHKEILSYMKF